MRTLRHLVILSLVVLVAVFLAAPSAMAKKQLTEDELDMVTAAGEPMVITATDAVTYTDGSTFSLTLPSDAQKGLETLTLNNLVGELQIANAYNIQTSAASITGTQTNTITQSWGATHDLTASFASVAGVSAGNGGAGGSSLAAAGCVNTGATGTAKCAGQVASAGAGGAGGNGGNGASGVLAGAVTSDYADVIIAGATVNVDVDPVFSMTLDSTSQQGLLALVINNVVGMSQVANALNISAANVNMNPAAGGFLPGATQNVATTQVNTINQFRGTPYSRPLAPVLFSP